MTTRTIPFTDKMKVGLGYNRLNGDVLPSPAVQGTGISSIQGAGGQFVTTDCITVQDVKTLHHSLGVSVDAAGAYMGFSGSAKVDYVHSCDFSSFSSYVLVKVCVQDAFESIDNPVFVPDANELLTTNNNTRFRERFGDAYITGVKKGGEYFAIFQVSSSNQTERENVATNVHLAYGAAMTSAELNTSIKSATDCSASNLNVSVHVFRQGTVHTADLNLEDIMTTARAFPVDVAGNNAFPYAVELQEYFGLKNPNDKFDYIQIQNQQDVLEDLAKKRFEFLALRDDFKYVLKHSADFQNADGTAVNRDAMSKNFDEVDAAINTMTKQASACSRDAGQCNFTTFDTSKYVLPVATQKSTDPDVAKGSALARLDPLALALLDAQPDRAARRGFLIGMAAADGQTLDGPDKRRKHDQLPADEQRGYALGVRFSVDRNRNAPFAAQGAKVALADPSIAAVRNSEPPSLYTLGFDIASGIFGPKPLGGGYLPGAGSMGRLPDLDADGQRGFNASMELNLKHGK